MSHSCKDSVGGHIGSWISVGKGEVYSAQGRRFAKRWNRREARREARAIVAEGLQALEDERQLELEMHEANEAFYEMLYEDDDWLSDYSDEEYEREQRQAEADEYDQLYGSYYDDDLSYDYFRLDDFYRATEPVETLVRVDPFSDSGESLGDILARALVERNRL